MSNSLFQSIRELIAKGKTKEAVAKMLELVVNHFSDEQDTAIQISSQHHRLLQDKIKGILSYDVEQIGLARINNSILEFLKTLEEKPLPNKKG